ncbi:phage major capsid protein [Oceanobacillus oncorhynchi]|uniref:phage major capsid protein n=1 Tax=Oceanobacillus oncorhynchi TaxID=545501 RepID=UPI001868D621
MKERRAAIAEELRDMKTKADEKKEKLDQKKFDELFAESEELRGKIKQEEKLQGLEGDLNEPEPLQTRGASASNADGPDYRGAFLKAIRGRNLSSEEVNMMEEHRALSVHEGEDGGYVIPEDITTQINQLRNTVDSLEQYVNVEPVATMSGARTLEKRADSTPFAPLSEYGDPDELKEMDTPQFTRLTYEIEDYAGFLPVPNNLLADSDQALEQYLRQWIAKKSRATRNHLILKVLEDFDKVDFSGYEDIKTTLNVTLDPAFSQGATIFTNQDGFDYLDQLKDGTGRPLLTPDPQNATQRRLLGRPVVVLGNKTIPSEDGKAPVIVGQLNEAITLWDREQMSLDMTQTGGNAWRTNTTEFRAIEREDVTPWDEEAIVYGLLSLDGNDGEVEA